MNFQVNQVNYNEDHSTPVDMIVPNYNRNKVTLSKEITDLRYIDCIKWFEDMYLIVNSRDNRYTLKAIFGKQLKTVTYTHRNWIWTFSSGDQTNTREAARIWILGSITGNHYEYDNRTRKTKCLELLHNVRKHMIDTLVDIGAQPKYNYE